LGLGAVCVGVGIGMSAIQILPYSSVPDVIEIDEYYNGVRREGAYYGIVSLMYKVASGLAILIVSWTLQLFGYIEGEGVTQPESAKVAIRLIIAILPGIIFIISTFFAYRAKISRESLNDIKSKIEERKLIKDN
jgi:GPH family glycoside/pentoside/hexuronide:cation symporter